jgi:hypothetical protein
VAFAQFFRKNPELQDNAACLRAIGRLHPSRTANDGVQRTRRRCLGRGRSRHRGVFDDDLPAILSCVHNISRLVGISLRGPWQIGVLGHEFAGEDGAQDTSLWSIKRGSIERSF